MMLNWKNVVILLPLALGLIFLPNSSLNDSTNTILGNARISWLIDNVQSSMNITDDTVWDGETIILDQNLFVFPNTSLTILNTHVFINSTLPGSIRIEVGPNANLTILSSFFQPIDNNEQKYYIITDWNSHFLMRDSSVAKAGWVSTNDINGDNTGVLVRSKNAVVVNNSFVDNYVGFHLKDTNDAIIANNTVFGGRYGILLNVISHSNVTNNTITDVNMDGILVNVISTKTTIVSQNTILSAGDAGISVENQGSVVVTSNTIIDSGTQGIAVRSSINAWVKENNVSGSANYGISIKKSTECLIELNTIIANTNGLHVEEAWNNRVRLNNFSQNEHDLILANYRSQKSQNYTQGNLFYGNNFFDGSSVLFVDSENPPTVSSFSYNYFHTESVGNYWAGDNLEYDLYPLYDPISLGDVVETPLAEISILSGNYQPGTLTIIGEELVEVRHITGTPEMTNVSLHLDSLVSFSFNDSTSDDSVTFVITDNLTEGFHQALFKVCNNDHCTPYAVAFWTQNNQSGMRVDSTQSITGESLFLSDDLVVEKDGFLTINDSTVVISSSPLNLNQITVQKGGLLAIDRSVVKPADLTNSFNIVVEYGGRLVLTNSRVENLVSYGHTSAGISLNSHNNIIRNSTIVGTELVVNGEDNILTNNTFLRDLDQSIYNAQVVILGDQKWVFVEYNNFIGLENNGVGCFVRSSSDQTEHYRITNNLFRDLDTGIMVDVGPAKNMTLTDNTFYNNQRGVALLKGSSNLIVRNTFMDNNVAALDNTNLVNYWSYQGEGNYWSDRSNNSYSISGSTNATDNYPSTKPLTRDTKAPVINSISPNNGTVFDKSVTIRVEVVDVSQFAWLTPSGLSTTQVIINGSTAKQVGEEGTVTIVEELTQNSTFTITVETWDKDGNKASRNFILSVVKLLGGTEKPNRSFDLSPLAGILLLGVVAFLLVFYRLWTRSSNLTGGQSPEESFEWKMMLLKYLHGRINNVLTSPKMMLLGGDDFGDSFKITTGHQHKEVFLNKINSIDVLVLVEIAERYPTPSYPSKLSGEVKKGRPVVSRSIKRLNELGYIIQCVSAKELQDSRFRGYTISEGGAAFLFWLRNHLERAFDQENAQPVEA